MHLDFPNINMEYIDSNPKEWEKILKIGDKNYYPSSPSKEELKIMEKYFVRIIKKIKGIFRKSKVLVLGATHGLRDMAIKYDCEVTSVDISKDAFASMNKLMHYKSDKENIIVDNWLTVPLKKNHFDVVLGDLVFNNVKYQEHSLLFKRLKTFLKQGGYLITRNAVHIHGVKKRTIKEIVKDYRDGKIGWRDLKYLIRYFLSESWSKWYNKRTRESYWERYFDYVKKAYEKGIMNKDEFKSLYREACNIVSTIPSKKEFEALMEEHFNRIRCVYSPAYQYAVTTPIYVARVRK